MHEAWRHFWVHTLWAGVVFGAISWWRDDDSLLVFGVLHLTGAAAMAGQWAKQSQK